MVLTSEELSELTADVSTWTMQDVSATLDPALLYTTLRVRVLLRTYYSVAYAQVSVVAPFYVIFLYHYLTTLAEEKWRTGKILFIFLRYAPMISIAEAVLPVLRTVEFRVHIPIAPKVILQRLLSSEAAFLFGHSSASIRVNIIISEIVLLLCLHALLGAKRRYLTLMAFIYTGLTIGGLIPQLKYIEETSRAALNTQLDLELGYACSWEGIISSGSLGGRTMGTFALALGVLFRLGYYNIAATVVHGLQTATIPIIACRLLVNMGKVEDPTGGSIVSSILFEPPRASHSSGGGDEDEELGRLANITPFAGLGRRIRIV
ncbi:hypothetical protein DFP72DRAFT_848823 [Ephemerocybe angulata]|uniref:Uncharacterized protein n=1 Tax=Ephemerocybe angulata TaxID=980116 RepID=A0A8H6HVC4_9AGAR|nr:hypothetical protein DFP72DRAFT_848823 [Tulosesus angulatus]